MPHRPSTLQVNCHPNTGLCFQSEVVPEGCAKGKGSGKALAPF